MTHTDRFHVSMASIPTDRWMEIFRTELRDHDIAIECAKQWNGKKFSHTKHPKPKVSKPKQPRGKGK